MFQGFKGKILSFKPFDKAKTAILEALKDYADMLEEIGEPDLAAEQHKIIEGINLNGITPYERDIQNYIIEAFDSVCGEPYKYLNGDTTFFDAVCEYYDPSCPKP